MNRKFVDYLLYSSGPFASDNPYIAGEMSTISMAEYDQKQILEQLEKVSDEKPAVIGGRRKMVG